MIGLWIAASALALLTATLFLLPLWKRRKAALGESNPSVESLAIYEERRRLLLANDADLSATEKTELEQDLQLALLRDYAPAEHTARAQRTRPAGVLVGAAILFPLAAILLYAAFGQWRDLDLAALTERALQGDTDAAQSLTEALGKRLQEDEQAAALWMLLGFTRQKLGDAAGAVTAFERVRAIGGEDPILLANLAQARLTVEGGQMSAATREIARLGQKLAPEDPIFAELLALDAFANADYANAAALLQQALALGVPEQRAALLRQGIETARERLVAETGPGIDIHVRLAQGVQLPPETAIFVFASALEEPGPPLAAVRRPASDLPFKIRLSAANAIIPGRNLLTATLVRVTARAALSGDESDPEAVSGPLDLSQPTEPVRLVLERGL